MAKTLMMFEGFGDGDTVFFELDGDYRHLDGVILNGGAPKGMSEKKYDRLVDELSALVYHADSGDMKLTQLREPTKDWDHFVRCGSIP